MTFAEQGCQGMLRFRQSGIFPEVQVCVLLLLSEVTESSRRLHQGFCVVTSRAHAIQ
jgi:hypothetical protein